MTLKKLRHY